MPRFDGMGPRGEGPLTGQGEGYCVMRLPRPGTGEAVVGYAGMQGTPVQSESASTSQPLARLPAPTPSLGAWPRGNWRRARRISPGRRRRFGARRR